MTGGAAGAVVRTAMFKDMLIPYDTEREAFGAAWCGPATYELHEEALVAAYPKVSNDGQSVKVYCCAMPARFYTLRVEAGRNSVGEPQEAYEVATGSGAARLAAELAFAISECMIVFRPTTKEAMA